MPAHARPAGRPYGRRAGVFASLLILCLTPGFALAADRLAFVVGIDTYPALGAAARLERPAADARTVATALEQLGYRVTLLSGAVTQEAMLRRFGGFADGVRPGDTALVYFAGHGIALQGTNFLLPSDIPAIEPGQEMLARSRALAETDLSAALRERGARVVVMVIDACRDNPFPKAGTRSIGQARGLARADPADGVFSLYAASAGQQALDRLPGDDPSPNSVFTRVFADKLKRRDLNLIDLGESVRDDVARLAETVPHRQVPAYYNAVRGARFVSLASPDVLPGSNGLEPRPAPVIAVRPSDPPAPRPPQTTAASNQPVIVGFSHPVGLDPTGDNWVALRSLPGANAGTRLAKLGPDTLFSVLGRNGDWAAVRLRDGRTGYVRADFVGCCRRAPAVP